MKGIRFNSTIFVVFMTITITACNETAAGAQSLVILPEDCQLPISNQIGLTLSGVIDPNSQITWQTNFGSIVANSQGVSALYTSPSVPGEALIIASVTSGINTSTKELKITCRIFDPRSPTTLPIPTRENVATSMPLSQIPTLIISELMGNPCGDLGVRKYNQYIELYNYGDHPVDVSGWWLYDEGYSGTPDRLIAWSEKSPVRLADNLTLDSTIIPPKGVAVILSPLYAEYQGVEKMPYRFPTGVVILTVTDSSLGDDYFGIISDRDGYDTLTLYIGGATVIHTVVDTYGTPSIPSLYPVDIDDDRNDNIPVYLGNCYSVERIDPRLPDAESNWRRIYMGTPGEVPYNK